MNSALAELATRRTAMKAATDSADDLLMSLRQRINPARQAQITEEINEIISGADALADPKPEWPNGSPACAGNGGWGALTGALTCRPKDSVESHPESAQ